MRATETTINTWVMTFSVASTTSPEFIDITDKVTRGVSESGIKNGFALVFSKHTTASITIQENEPLLLQDLTSLLERFSPKNAYYRHNDFSVRTVHMEENECPNGHSHCQHITLGSSETIPVIDGVPALGRYQSVFMVELDGNKASPREIILQLVGL